MKKNGVFLSIFSIAVMVACSDGPREKVEPIGDTVEVFVVPEAQVKRNIEVVEFVDTGNLNDTLNEPK